MSVKYVDYYQTLEIEKNASSKDIQAAYRRLARKYHPDVNKESDAEEKFKLINEAYEVLKDPEKRKKYDTLGANWNKNYDYSGSSWGNFNPNSQGFSGDFSDFFEAIFGGARTGASPYRTDFPAKRDTQVAISISLEDIFQGGKKAIQLTDSNGEEPRNIEFKIPRGIKNGSTVRLRGQGNLLPGGSKGDLLIKLEFKTHSKFEAIEHDLYVQLPISPWAAILGGKFEVEMLDGATIEVTLPSSVQNGQKLRVKGKGLPKKEGYGDLYVIANVKIPKEISPEQRQLIEKLAQMDEKEKNHCEGGGSCG